MDIRKDESRDWNEYRQAFMLHVEELFGCWMWKKSNFQFYIEGSQHNAVRASWLLFRDKDIPNKMTVRRTCTNKLCVAPAHLTTIQDRLTADPTHSTCRTCLVSKPTSDFFMASKRTKKLFLDCKQCVAAYRRSREPQLKVSRQKWIANNLDKHKQSQRAHYVQNKARYDEAAKNYSRTHRHLTREWCRKRSVMKKKASGSHSPAQWEAVKASQNNLCFYCKSLKRLARDHQIPLTRGGSDEISNVVASCWSCNSRKGAKTPAEFASFILTYRSEMPVSLIEFAEDFVNAALAALTGPKAPTLFEPGEEVA